MIATSISHSALPHPCSCLRRVWTLGGRGSPGGCNSGHVVLVGGRAQVFGGGFENTLSICGAFCCDGPQERDVSAALVVCSLVLAGEVEEQLAARTIISMVMEKRALLQRRTSFLSEKQCTSPRKPPRLGRSYSLQIIFLKKGGMKHNKTTQQNTVELSTQNLKMQR